jgi:hypothetical protein
MSEDSAIFGGGSGGDGENTKDEFRFIDGTFSATANQVELVSRAPLPPAPPKPCLISILAADIMELKGSVNVHGMGGVNITSGPPPLPPMDADTEGMLLQCGEIQKITLKRGLIDGMDQMIEMTPSGITVDGGSMPVTIQSLTQIKLSVAGGLSTITMGPDGIEIQGMPMIMIQGVLVKIN